MHAAAGQRAHYFAAIWLFAALTVVLSGAVQRAIGGRLQLSDTFFNAVIFLEWAAAAPLLVRLARAVPPSLGARAGAFHVPISLAAAFAVLALHKLMLCDPRRYADCICAYQFDSLWIYAWLVMGVAMYATNVVGTWLLDAAEDGRSNELAAARVERDVTAAELRVALARVDPGVLVGYFDSLAARVHETQRAEEMITALADYLRAAVRALTADEYALGDDLELLRAWSVIEGCRARAPIDVRVAVDDGMKSIPLAAPVLEPRLRGRTGIRAVEVAATADRTHLALRLRVDGEELPVAMIEVPA